MSAELLQIEDSKLEKVSGGLIIEKVYSVLVSRVIASKDEYGYIMCMGYSKDRGLTAEDVRVVKFQLSRFGLRVKSYVKLTPKRLLPEAKHNANRIELVVID